MKELYGFPEEVPPFVFLELLVNDPPPPPPEWLALSEEERSERPVREWAAARLWPREDRRALRAAAEAHAREIGVPDAIDTALPVLVALVGETEAREEGLRFPHIAAEAARAR